MSTMVAITAGAEAKKIGINKRNCVKDILKSINHVKTIKTPEIRH